MSGYKQRQMTEFSKSSNPKDSNDVNSMSKRRSDALSPADSKKH